MAAGDPTGADLCVGTTNGDTLPEYGDDPGWEEREITFVTPVELTEGVKYAIVVRIALAAGESELYWAFSVNNPYANGDNYNSDDSGDSWAVSEDDDTWFKTKVLGVEKDIGVFDQDGFDGADSAHHGVNWMAQTFTASSTYAPTAVILKLAKYTTWGGTPGTVTVSIRATDTGLPGAPTLVSPTPTGVTNITLDETPLEWAAGDPAGDTYEIYFRESGDEWPIEPNGAAQAGVEWTIDFGTLNYGTTYEWRIDATNIYGTTEGTTWSFDTIVFDQLRISYVLITGGSGAGPYDTPPGVEGTDWRWTGENNMLAVRRLVAAANSKIWYESI